MAEIICQRSIATRAASLGTTGDIKSEWWATSFRNAWATSSESAACRHKAGLRRENATKDGA